jgi:hypothetical protein
VNGQSRVIILVLCDTFRPRPNLKADWYAESKLAPIERQFMFYNINQVRLS